MMRRSHPTEAGHSSILDLAACLISAGTPPANLNDGMIDALWKRDGAWAEGVLAGTETPDLPRLAQLVAAGALDLGKVEYLLDRDAEAAIWEAEQRLRRPDPGDDPGQLRCLIARLQAVREHRQHAWDDVLARADFAFDATITYAAAAPNEPLNRPTTSIDVAVSAVSAAARAAVAGDAARHLLIVGDCGTRKTRSTLKAVALRAEARRALRRRFIEDYRRNHPESLYADAARAADAAGLRPLRVLYLAETHKLVGDTVKLARELGMLVEHHAGRKRPFDPADLTSPPACTQPERVRQTQLAGESVPDKACGRTEGAKTCPDRAGCRFWQRLANCARTEVVGTTIDQAFAPYLPRELTGFDLVIIDEALDRVGYAGFPMPLDYLSDRYFEAHPVLGPDGEPDPAASEAARAEYKVVRDTLEAAPNGYAPKPALRELGFDEARWQQLIAWTNARERDSGITAATPDTERAALAQVSFRRQIGALCNLFRHLASPEDGRVQLADDDKHRHAIVRSICKLHPTILAAPIIALDASADLTSWRRFIPDLEVATVPKPAAPHQTAVQIVRPNGKHAMRRPERKAYDQALVKLYKDEAEPTEDRPFPNSVLTHKEHLADFSAPGIATSGYGGLTGSNDHKDCSVLFAFGLPSLSPEAAAYAGAGRTGEAVVPVMPVRTLRPALLKGGGVVLVPSMEFKHPAAREAQLAVRERQAIQGPGGRPRASSRTADHPVLLLYSGTTPLPDIELDAVITSPEQFAPDRFVRMVAAELVVASGRDRHRLHPEIYPKRHTAEYDTPREIGGMVPTLQRVLYPRWWGDRRRATWIVLRYWVAGRGNRVDGRLAACPIGKLAWAKQRLQEVCRAVRSEVVAEIHRPAAEVTRIPVHDDLTWILGTCPRRHRGPLFQASAEPEDADCPPDS